MFKVSGFKVLGFEVLGLRFWVQRKDQSKGLKLSF